MMATICISKTLIHFDRSYHPNLKLSMASSPLWPLWLLAFASELNQKTEIMDNKYRIFLILHHQFPN
jgi:hypothetical protein